MHSKLFNKLLSEFEEKNFLRKITAITLCEAPHFNFIAFR
jgi:hypothetical protein